MKNLIMFLLVLLFALPFYIYMTTLSFFRLIISGMLPLCALVKVIEYQGDLIRHEFDSVNLKILQCISNDVDILHNADTETIEKHIKKRLDDVEDIDFQKFQEILSGNNVESIMEDIKQEIENTENSLKINSAFYSNDGILDNGILDIHKMGTGKHPFLVEIGFPKMLRLSHYSVNAALYEHYLMRGLNEQNAMIKVVKKYRFRFVSHILFIVSLIFFQISAILLLILFSLDIIFWIIDKVRYKI